MPEYKVLRSFTDAEGLHEVGSTIKRSADTEDEQFDLDAMIHYGMLEKVPEKSPKPLTVEAALRKSKDLGKPKNSRKR